MVRASAVGQPAELEQLAHSLFGSLSQAEINLLSAAPKGQMAVCGPGRSREDPANHPGNATEWGPDRQIRAELLRWLCVDQDAKTCLDPRGIGVAAAKIVGELDLSFVVVPFPLRIFDCCLTSDAHLNSAQIMTLNLTGSWVRSIEADTATVQGHVLLKSGFQAEGHVWLLGAQIKGQLDCSNGTFTNPARAMDDGSGMALSVESARVGGGVFLCDGFHAQGEVRLLRAQIEGTLDCRNGAFINPLQEGLPQSGRALSADGLIVQGSIFLRYGFRAEGEVRLSGAQIGGGLSCLKGTFQNPAQAVETLYADSVDIPGRKSGGALIADGARIKGDVLLQNGFRANGEVSLMGAQVGGTFNWFNTVSPELATLNLINASVGAITDDDKSWPERGSLFVDGFVYRRIDGPRDFRSRLRWLDRQREFRPQPYRQLAKVLREEGDEAGGRRVLFEMERLRRQKDDRGWLARSWTAIVRVTIGLGYYPARSLLWLLGLTILCTILFWTGYVVGSVTPSDKDAYGPFKQSGRLPPHYERFHASAYALENSFPLVRLGQVERWQPDPNPDCKCKPASLLLNPLCSIFSPPVLRWFHWAQICLGWFFTTMFVAGVTGVVRKD
jgi:hypothetical protein